MFKWLKRKEKPTPLDPFGGYPKVNIRLIYSHMVNAEPRFKLKGYWVNG